MRAKALPLNPIRKAFCSATNRNWIAVLSTTMNTMMSSLRSGHPPSSMPSLNPGKRELSSTTGYDFVLPNDISKMFSKVWIQREFRSRTFESLQFSFSQCNSVNRKYSVSASSTPKPKSKSGSKSNLGSKPLNFSIESDIHDSGRALCPGCGIEMQDRDPTAPGYFKRPTGLNKAPVLDFDPSDLDDDLINVEDDEEEDEDGIDSGSEVEMEFNVKSIGKSLSKSGDKSSHDSEFDETPEVGFEDFDGELDPNVLGFGFDGPKFTSLDDLDEETKAEIDAWNKLWDEDDKKERKVKNKKKDKKREEKEKVTVCARCHSLRHYGYVKDKSIENLLPDFDFDQVVGSRLRNAYGRRSIVVMVIDGSDFDGSFPKVAAQILTEAESLTEKNFKEGKASNTFRLLIVVNKVDLIPKQVSAVRFEHWIRRRAKAGGAPRVSGVFIVSAKSGLGVQRLSNTLQDLAGPRGDVWVVGAQNAGKSSLINALIKLKKASIPSSPSPSPSLLPSETDSTSSSSSSSSSSSPPSPPLPALLTEASLPGTTIGVVTMEGILPKRIRLLDTPGLIHPHQITTRLTEEELRMVLPRKLLKPRSFRIKVENTLHIGGLARIDVLKGPSESLYLTVWVSSYIPCHMGKLENADSVFSKHVGDRLQPPLDAERVRQLGKWLPRTVRLEGDKWDESSVDVAIAGLGWIGVAVNGRADLRVYTYEGVSVTVREAMVLDLDKEMQRPGFSHVVPLPPTKTNEKGERKKETSRATNGVGKSRTEEQQVDVE